MKLTNLCKTYATKTGEKVHALKNVSFDLPKTGMVVILGKSGCGKSTLLNILGGLDRFDSGDVECFGRSLKGLSRKELEDYRNCCVGFVFQEYNLIPELDVFDNIALPLQLQGQTDNDEKSGRYYNKWVWWALIKERSRSYPVDKSSESPSLGPW